MRSLLLVVLLASSAWAQSSPLGPLLGGLMQTRVYAHGTRIKNMEAAIDRLEERVNTAISRGRDVYVNSLNNLVDRVHDIEGTGCPEYQFQCGDDLHHCIEDTLVCDGYSDCDNGHDEEQSVCYNPVPAGASFHGKIHFSHCATLPDFEMRMFVTATRNYEWFTPRTLVRATLVSSGRAGNDITFSAQGQYNYGSRKLTLTDPDNTNASFAGLELDCTFAEHDKEHASCYLVEIFTHQECAELKLTRDH